MTIAVVATGGTISSHLTDAGWTSLDGRTLVDEVADRFAGIEVTVTDVAPSTTWKLVTMRPFWSHTKPEPEPAGTSCIVPAK